MRMVSFVGWSGSGKTTLITRLIENLRASGRRVVAVKGSHAGATLQPDGKDTARFLQAGAEEVFLVTGTQMLRMTPLASADDLFADLEARLGPRDIVLLEGLTREGVPLIEVQDPHGNTALKTAADRLAAVVGVAGVPGRPHFHPDDIAAIARFVEGTDE